MFEEEHDGGYQFHMEPEPGELAPVKQGLSINVVFDGNAEVPPGSKQADKACYISAACDANHFCAPASPGASLAQRGAGDSGPGTPTSNIGGKSLPMSPRWPKLSSAVGMGTTPPDAHPLLSPIKLKAITSAVESPRAGDVADVEVKEKSLAGVGQLPQETVKEADRFDFMFHRPSSQGLSPIASPSSSLTPLQQKAAEQFAAQAQEDLDINPEFSIERPTCPQTPLQKPERADHPSSTPEPLRGFKQLAAARQVAGFAVPPKPPLNGDTQSAAPGSAAEHSTPAASILSPASGLVNQVTKKAASLFGSAMDLVSLGGNSSNNGSDGEPSPAASRKNSKSSFATEPVTRSKGSTSELRRSLNSASGMGVRVPSVSDLVSFMWLDGPSSNSTARAGLSPMATLQSRTPGQQRTSSQSGRKTAAWNGLRHSPIASGSKPSGLSQQRPPSSARKSARKGMSSRGSAPNLAAMDTSSLVYAASRAHNLQRFEEHYVMTTSLGTGGYAIVRKCVHKATGKEYAVKVMQLSTESETAKPSNGDGSDGDEDEDECMTLREISNELHLMCQLNHPNIVRAQEFFIQDGQCLIVMQLLEGPELMDALVEVGQKNGMEDGEAGSYTESDARTVMGALFDAIAYMHETGITHRDLKLENLVLARAGDLSSVTIVDFGLAKAARAREKMEETCGTPWYSSPELLHGDPYTQAVDIWSLGVAMYVLLSGDFPFDHEDEDELIELIIEGDIQMSGPKWESISPQAKDLIRGLLELDPKKRLTAVEAIEHPWFTGEMEMQTASELHHAHVRLSHLVDSAPGRLPVAIFEPGDWICVEGERGKHVYMILAGEAEVVRTKHPTEEYCPAPPGADPSMYQDVVKVRTLRKGNFAGQLAQHFAESASRSSLDSKRRGSTDGRQSGVDRLRTIGSADIHQIMMDAHAPVAAPASPSGHRMVSIPSSNFEDLGPMSMASSMSDVSDLDSLSSGPPSSYACASPSDASHLTMPPSPKGWMGTAMKGLGVISTLMRVRRAWVGMRRTASVRAVTQVKALVLNREDMQWAVEHDYRLTTELQDAMRKQRKKLRAMARARKKEMLEKQKNGDAN
eukprot:jgi/Tetstr1/424373/TSEL_014934.t1